MSPSRLDFQLEAQATGSRARAATFRTLHSTVRTPLFMPVGTQATVKAQLPETLHESGSQILLANTYHLLLRPGPEVFKRMGGIHQFMQWPGSVLTDSGGYQIFSLPHSRSMTEAGAVFQSYVDGQRILLSPELSIQTQMAIGSDIMMVLDQCIPSTADEAAARAALQVTQRWAVRSLAAREDSPQSMFAIVQGALYPHLRRESAEGLMQLPFDGFAIGGLAVGEEKAEREDTCEMTACLLPQDRPRYLMGVGTPLDVLEAVHRGVDMFDCIIPTQVAKRGSLFTSRGIVQLRRSVYKFSEERLDPDCTCPVCAKYTRAYLHHLTKTQEPLGWQLMGQHNIHFYHQLMREIRQSILEDRFLKLYHEKRQILQVEDVDHPITTVKPPVISPDHAQRMGDYELELRAGEAARIFHIGTGQTVNTDVTAAAWTEDAHLATHLRLPAGESAEESMPLIVWDIGLGAGAAAIAAILTYEMEADKGPVRPMHIVSLTNDLSPLRLALSHKRHFPYLRHGAADTLLHRNAWTSRYKTGLTWTLLQGPLDKTIPQAPSPPEATFHQVLPGMEIPIGTPER
ncbi:queuine tRNA-ribosyltransferase [Prosthecobacter fusiformis]|uniref:Queuine tRNA-ribosyltransferase n=1 Tax=Prosthecobacter fusiformis TaxID=48464 RepID=A0A4R7RR84_9BACT|nr:tRNA guanosine(34) transglycosylase Tgt [Prosthecobacter fusiformis]TDU67226.1 queuine tRNA-ribosyltransferase [Prosthecobacter fusiformis]